MALKINQTVTTREGFVVIPSISPVSLRSFMTSTSTVSKKKSILFWFIFTIILITWKINNTYEFNNT